MVKPISNGSRSVFLGVDTGLSSIQILGMETKENVNLALMKFLSNHSEIHTAILFGSFATGNLHKESDLDFAIATSNSISAKQKLNYLFELNQLINVPNIDLVDFSTSSGIIDREILTKGIILRKEDEFLSKKIRDMYYYSDFYLPKLQKNLIDHLNRELVR
ncbi:MAG: nucleotidyltransferase domain-containing protein [Leptospira sp.]|nr:nucleotidyltransferase domain-containing protein [Leptospira sp.]